MEADPPQPFVAYLNALPGVSCTIPMDRVRQLAGPTMPPAATAVDWWTQAGGWRDSPTARACLAAGWRLQSVYGHDRLVRFVWQKPGQPKGVDTDPVGRQG